VFCYTIRQSPTSKSSQLKGAKGNGDTGLSGFGAVEWAWHIRVINGVAYSRNKLALVAYSRNKLALQVA